MNFTDEELEQMSIMSIRNYLNKDFSDDYIKKHFGLAIKKLINNANEIGSIKKAGVSSISENGISMSFDNSIESMSITADIKMLLPIPYIKMY